jgi:putative nucleotidyltransferase with HDIG domain
VNTTHAVTDRSVDSLLDLAANAERGGDWSAALGHCQAAFRRAAAARDAALVREVALREANCYRHAGQPECARDILEMLVVVAERSGDPSRGARALNGLGSIAQAAGELDRAERRYLAARTCADRAGDEQVVGQVEQNLGILANIRGDLPSALRHYLAGLEILRRSDQEWACAAALNNLGMLHVDMDRLDEADRYFREALEVATRLEDVVTAGTIHINRTELYLRLGDTTRARASCDEGFEIASGIENHAHRAEALKFYGAIYRATGKMHLAEIHLLQAVEISTGREPLLEAEVQRELSLVLRELGRNREALAALNRAHALFSAVQAQSDQADIHRRIRALEDDFLSLVRYWGESIEAKDLYTGGHCERVAAYACHIARAVGFPDAELPWFRMGAFLHDIGKVEVAAEILNKPGKLDEGERATMERHTVIGDEILAPVEFPWDIRPMVRSHHERWDGTGYPDGLRGEEIDYAARILRIADVFDALTTARSYRRPLTPQEAFTLMDEDAGSFDPALFEVFRELFPTFAKLAEEAVVAGSAGAEAPPQPPVRWDPAAVFRRP